MSCVWLLKPWQNIHTLLKKIEGMAGSSNIIALGASYCQVSPSSLWRFPLSCLSLLMRQLNPTEVAQIVPPGWHIHACCKEIWCVSQHNSRTQAVTLAGQGRRRSSTHQQTDICCFVQGGTYTEWPPTGHWIMRTETDFMRVASGRECPVLTAQHRGARLAFL